MATTGVATVIAAGACVGRRETVCPDHRPAVAGSTSGRGPDVEWKKPPHPSDLGGVRVHKPVGTNRWQMYS